MKEKKLFEEVQFEIIKFDRNDIITTSGIEVLPPTEENFSGDINTPEIEF